MSNEVRVRIIGDDSGLQSSLKGIQTGVGVQALTAGLGELKNALTAPIQNASSLGESVNAVNVMFGDSSQAILDFGKVSASETGLATRDFQQMAAALSASLTNTGAPMDEVATMTIDLTKRAADMASVFNTDVDEALIALRAGLNGESEPLRRFGVNMNAAAVEAKALEMTGKDNAAALTDQEKAMARFELIMQATSKTQGDFKNTSGEWANAQRVLNAELENSRDELYGKLLPALTLGLGAFAALPPEVQVLGTEFLKLSPALAQVATGLVNIAPAVGAAAKALPALGAAFMTPPLGIVIALAAVGIALYIFRDDIIGVFNEVADTVVPIVEGIGSSIKSGLDTVLTFLRSNWPEIATLIAGPFAPLVILATDAFGIRSALQGALTGIVEFVGGIPSSLAQLGFGFASAGVGLAKAFVNGIIDMLNSGFNQLEGRQIIPSISAFGETIFPGVSLPNIPDIPRLASGTPFVPQDTLAFLHRGEAVLTSAQNAERRAGGGLKEEGVRVSVHANTVTINNAAPKDAARSLSDLGYAMAAAMRARGLPAYAL